MTFLDNIIRETKVNILVSVTIPLVDFYSSVNDSVECNSSFIFTSILCCKCFLVWLGNIGAWYGRDRKWRCQYMGCRRRYAGRVTGRG